MRQFWPVKSKEVVKMSTLLFKFGIAATRVRLSILQTGEAQTSKDG